MAEALHAQPCKRDQIQRHGLAWIGLILAVFFLLASHTETAQAQAADRPSQALSLSPLFITLSDAMDASKAGNPDDAARLLTQLHGDFLRLKSHDSPKGRLAEQRLKEAIAQPASLQLGALSNALLAFEREQNPVDYTARRTEFKRKIEPAYAQLQSAIDRASEADASTLSAAYQRFNRSWVSSERVVRSTSLGHYGGIETAMALMRVAIETRPLDLEKVRSQSARLKETLDSYNAGESVAAPKGEFALADGLQLLRDAQAALVAKDLSQGQAKLTRFIEIWPIIEGEVSTRAPGLYSRVESQIPVVLAHGESPAQQQQLKTLIDDLSRIDTTAQYSALDAMLILLREGLEALLIVIALVSALNAARQEAGKRWIYGGVLAGLLASVAAALVLQRALPATLAGSSREMVEGLAGVVTVLMMLLVGAWLHSKSSVQAWDLYLKRQLGRALTTGSLVSLFGLSFLSVFREGAETILFYAGILPKISLSNFVTGVGMALAALAVIAFILIRTSYRLPIARMFRLLTWVIYGLGFKILGISLHALQLTGHLRMSPLQASWLESPSLGLFPTLETLGAQAAYLASIGLIQWTVNRSLKRTVLSLQTSP